MLFGAALFMKSELSCNGAALWTSPGVDGQTIGVRTCVERNTNPGEPMCIFHRSEPVAIPSAQYPSAYEVQYVIHTDGAVDCSPVGRRTLDLLAMPWICWQLPFGRVVIHCEPAMGAAQRLFMMEHAVAGRGTSGPGFAVIAVDPLASVIPVTCAWLTSEWGPSNAPPLPATSRQSRPSRRDGAGTGRGAWHRGCRLELASRASEGLECCTASATAEPRARFVYSSAVYARVQQRDRGSACRCNKR
jgi:hypothetical protein